jgi:hypothetical protein
VKALRSLAPNKLERHMRFVNADADHALVLVQSDVQRFTCECIAVMFRIMDLLAPPDAR